MKRILLDTHVLIWWLEGNLQLGSHARETISNSDNAIYVSAATVWEMSIKQQLGKLKAPDDIVAKVEEAGFSQLAISLFHGQAAGRLPPHHKDPFDRMLIAQAQAEGLQLLTKDGQFAKYGISIISALI